MDSADQHSPQDTVTLYQGKNEYTATFNKYSDGGVEVINLKATSTGGSTDSSWKKPSSKKELAEMLASGMSRDDIMSKAKEAGVTWKEHEHAGINWMRCSMALTGATTKDTKSDKPVKEAETKQDNTDENKKNDSPDSTKNQDKNSGFWNSARNYEDFLKNQVKNSNLEVKSVIGSDYTQLTTEKESGTIKGEAHNMMVGKLNSEGKKQPSEKEIKTAAKELKESAIKTVIKSFNQDTIVHELAMAKQFAKLSGESIDHLTLENLYKDVVSGHGSYTQEQKCNALSKLMGKDYDTDMNDNVVRYSSNSMSSVHVRPLSRGNFEVTFEYDDGEQYKETYDSGKAVSEACDRFIEKEEAEANKPKKLVNPSVSDVDKVLTEKFPYDNTNKYETIGTVDTMPYPDHPNQMRLSVPHLADVNKVTSYLKEIGATYVKVENQGKGKDQYALLYFDFNEK